ncbi:MAG: hypothetical protein AAF616_16035, partial [Bacteroidota bacterium]
MKKSLRSLLLAFGLIVALSIVSCSEDETEEVNVAASLVGTWTGGSISIDAITVDGESLSDYLEALKQTLVDDFNYTAEEAELFTADLETLFEEDFETDDTGTLTFKSDGTYEGSDASGTETGTWELSSDEKVLTLDKGTDLETVIAVVSVTDSQFTGTISSTEFIELDEESLDGEFEIQATIT